MDSCSARQRYGGLDVKPWNTPSAVPQSTVDDRVRKQAAYTDPKMSGICLTRVISWFHFDIQDLSDASSPFSGQLRPPVAVLDLRADVNLFMRMLSIPVVATDTRILAP